MLGLFVMGHPPDSHPLAHIQHHGGVVLLSLAMVWISCLAAIYMTQSNRSTRSISHRNVALLCAALLLGLGIWGMHFIGMLAVHFPVPVRFDTAFTLASILPGLLAAGFMLWAMHSKAMRWPQLLLCGVGAGLGIAAMHYSGLSAIYMAHAQILFELPYFVLSLLLGIVFSMAALACYRWLHPSSYTAPAWYGWCMPASLFAVGIAGMHYVAMHGMRIALSSNAPPTFSDLASDEKQQTLSMALAVVGGVVFVILGLAHALLRYRDMWKALQARDARLHAMIEAADMGFISADATGAILEFNPSAQRIFGYAREEVLGRSLSMLMPSPLAEQHDRYLQRHAAHPHQALTNNKREAVGKHKDGRLIPLQLSIGKAVTPMGLIFVGYVQDISLRKRRDAELRIASSVFHHVREGVAIIDANRQISDVNPAFERLMERDKDQCIGLTLETLYETAVTPPDLDTLWNTVATKHYWQSEITLTRRHGQMWVQRLSITPVLNKLQHPTHFIAVISDVTEHAGLEASPPQNTLRNSAPRVPT